MIYLDANATQPLRPASASAMLEAMRTTGNPSSVHAAGRAARRLVEDARDAVAGGFGVRGRDVVFVSGGTEADTLAVHALGHGRHLIVSAIEHDAIRAAAPDAAVLPVGRDGVIKLEVLERLLAGSGPALVCIMLANNETGVIQPVEQAAALCRRFGAVLHVDAVQAAGRMPVRLDATGAHSMAVSSHKLGGPAGVGALLLSPDAPFTRPLIVGGGQERGRRGGTPAVALLMGFAAAVRDSQADDLLAVADLRDQIDAAAGSRGAIVCGAPVGDSVTRQPTAAASARLPNTTCLALPGVPAMTQVMALDLEGIAVSAGAACSSGKVQESHVLRAMGLGALSGEAIRVSLAWSTVAEDVAGFIAVYTRMVDRLRPSLVGAPA